MHPVAPGHAPHRERKSPHPRTSASDTRSPAREIPRVPPVTATAPLRSKCGSIAAAAQSSGHDTATHRDRREYSQTPHLPPLASRQPSQSGFPGCLYFPDRARFPAPRLHLRSKTESCPLRIPSLARDAGKVRKLLAIAVSPARQLGPALSHLGPRQIRNLQRTRGAIDFAYSHNSQPQTSTAFAILQFQLYDFRIFRFHNCLHECINVSPNKKALRRLLGHRARFSYDDLVMNI